jgi:hypothetical protein
MLKVLAPVDGSSNSLHAVRHVLIEFRRNPAIDIHLLNVQPPFSSYVTRWIDRKTINEAHLEASEQTLRPTRQMLDEVCVPYSVHLAVGGKQARSQNSLGNCDATTSSSAPRARTRSFEPSRGPSPTRCSS